MNNKGNEYNKKGMMEVFERSMEEIKLSDEEIYLIDDDWFRGKMMVLNEAKFIGKAIGYIE